MHRERGEPRLHRSRFARRGDEPQHSPEPASGYAGLVLERLAEHTCRTLGVECTLVFARDRLRQRDLIAVAGRGTGEDLVGGRFRLSGGVLGTTIDSGRPSLIKSFSELGFPYEQERSCPIVTGGAAPVSWGGAVRGLIAAGSAADSSRFGWRELDTLTQMAELAAPALQHAEAGLHLTDATEACVDALSAAIELRDGYTASHAEAVVRLAGKVGRLLGLEPPELVELEFAARLHDVGKLGIDDAVLRKPGPLEPHEWSLIRRHPVWGANKLAQIPGLEPTAAIVRFHHERWDGGGYPDGLVGEEIPLASRIVAVCDAYSAMIEDRPYRAALSKDETVRELRHATGRQFDADVVEALLRIIEQDPA